MATPPAMPAAVLELNSASSGLENPSSSFSSTGRLSHRPRFGYIGCSELRTLPEHSQKVVPETGFDSLRNRSIYRGVNRFYPRGSPSGLWSNSPASMYLPFGFPRTTSMDTNRYYHTPSSILSPQLNQTAFSPPAIPVGSPAASAKGINLSHAITQSRFSSNDSAKAGEVVRCYNRAMESYSFIRALLFVLGKQSSTSVSSEKSQQQSQLLKPLDICRVTRSSSPTVVSRFRPTWRFGASEPLKTLDALPVESNEFWVDTISAASSPPLSPSGSPCYSRTWDYQMQPKSNPRRSLPSRLVVLRHDGHGANNFPFIPHSGGPTSGITSAPVDAERWTNKITRATSSGTILTSATVPSSRTRSGSPVMEVSMNRCEKYNRFCNFSQDNAQGSEMVEDGSKQQLKPRQPHQHNHYSRSSNRYNQPMLRSSHSEADLKRLERQVIGGFLMSAATGLPRDWHAAGAFWHGGQKRKYLFSSNPFDVRFVWHPNVGFHPCVATAMSLANASQRLMLMRPSRFDVLRAMWIDTAAITIQRHWRGKLGRKKAEERRRYKSWWTLASCSARKIQKGFRKFQFRLKLEQEMILQELIIKRQKAALLMQRCWKQRIQRFQEEERQLVETIRRIRSAAAIEIQRVFRGYKTRQLMDLDFSHWVLHWRWDPPGRIVEVVGSFTKPPWRKRILMSWSPTFKQYMVVLPRIVGRHELKFVVNGHYCCDGSLTVISDGAGHYNNVVWVPSVEPVPPFQYIRERLERYARKTPPCAAAVLVHNTIASFDELTRRRSPTDQLTSKSDNDTTSVKPFRPTLDKHSDHKTYYPDSEDFNSSRRLLKWASPLKGQRIRESSVEESSSSEKPDVQQQQDHFIKSTTTNHYHDKSLRFRQPAAAKRSEFNSSTSAQKSYYHYQHNHHHQQQQYRHHQQHHHHMHEDFLTSADDTASSHECGGADNNMISQSSATTYNNHLVSNPRWSRLPSSQAEKIRTSSVESCDNNHNSKTLTYSSFLSSSQLQSSKTFSNFTDTQISDHKTMSGEEGSSKFHPSLRTKKYMNKRGNDYYYQQHEHQFQSRNLPYERK